MKLTVLGNNGPFPGAGSACSGYLLEEGDTRLLIDCGNGVLANLQKLEPVDKVNAIILSHLHSDHISDMMVLKYAIQIKTKRGTFKGPVRVYAPATPEEEYKRLDARDAFILEPVCSSTILKFGGLIVKFERMKHPVETYAVSVDNGSKRFVFSGDSAWNEGLIRFSVNADLVMLDAGLLKRDKTGENVPHMTAEECGEAAVRANAKKLLLTHFWPEYDLNELLSEARQKYPGAELTELMKSYII